MTIVYDGADGRIAFIKGAPEVVVGTLGRRDPGSSRPRGLGDEGFRVLAVASDASTASRARRLVEAELELLGLVALHDPLRPTAAASIDEAHERRDRRSNAHGRPSGDGADDRHALGLAAAEIIARATPAASWPWSRNSRRRARSSPSRATASTTHPPFAARTSASPWGGPAPRQPGKQRRSCSQTTTSRRSSPQSGRADGSATTSASSSPSCSRRTSARCSFSRSRSSPDSERPLRSSRSCSSTS